MTKAYEIHNPDLNAHFQYSILVKMLQYVDLCDELI